MISYSISHTNCPTLPPSVCAIGYFDGLHTGHQKLIETAKAQAQKKGIACSVLTFVPDPWAILKPDEPLQHLSDLEDKTVMLEALGVDLFYIVDFTKAFAALSIDQFHAFLKDLNIQEIVCGFDFTYGFKGQGNAQSLLACDDFETIVVSKISDDPNGSLEKISSSRIEKLIAKGDMEKANELLGYLYSLKGTIVHGYKRGRELGFPTANLAFDEESFLPGSGVYAGFVEVDNTMLPAMINIGKNPTFQNKKITVEAYILNQSLQLYGQRVRFFFVARLRGEKKFDSLDQLKAQLAYDETQVIPTLTASKKLFAPTARIWSLDWMDGMMDKDK